MARAILLDLRPRFLWFDEEWRSLESEFDVIETAPRPATSALLGLVHFDLQELRRAVGNDAARVAELVEAANASFEALFTGRWRQANVRVYLHVDGAVLHIFARNAGGRLIPIAERSAGLRQFVALLAFIEHEAAGEDVILLVDEAEAHLHYDAQADLVRVFSQQTVADKIIYTTHSAGCLPSDLGTGVRVIEPVGPDDKPPEDWERSRVRNWFWVPSPDSLLFFWRWARAPSRSPRFAAQ